MPVLQSNNVISHHIFRWKHWHQTIWNAKFYNKSSSGIKANTASHSSFLVLQEIIAGGILPNYWTSESGNAEVEFILQGADEVIPVKVKAGHNAKAKSLSEFLRRYAPKSAIRTTLNAYACGSKILDIPLYAFGSFLKTIPKGELTLV